MKRTYKKRPLFGRARWGQLGLALFVIFIAYRILTPPSDESAPVAAPDGMKEARLKAIHFYADHTSYKVQWRETGHRAWRVLQNFPAFSNAPPGAAAEMVWSEDSDRLDFLLNGTSVWHHVFAE